jgi:pimeloyl-ACP methyl ester carboxylesterase
MSANPFGVCDWVQVAGGELLVARAGPPVGAGEMTVLAVHGMSASYVSYRTVTRELGRRLRASVLAPDLRGRGRSAHLPGPFGIGAHVADLLAVLDDARAQRAVLVGHSMGAYVVARLAAEHPERVAGVVLLDGGLPDAAPPYDPDAVIDAVVGPALERPHVSYASVADYVASWRAHPAFARAWNADVEAYVRHDVVSDGRAAHCVVSQEAVRIDSRDLLLDDATRTALDRVRAPVHLLRAPRGVRDDDDPVLPRPVLDRFLAAHPDVGFEEVADVNHYTLVLGASPGPARVAATIEQCGAGVRRGVSSLPGTDGHPSDPETALSVAGAAQGVRGARPAA